ncbi:MAG: hypothetical protein IRY91_07095, partial [Gemmatimonadaceae bacterium]|nr:hypothetical protein [Gemmatimonadaceae bacterium]
MIGLPGFKKRLQDNGMADLSPPGGPSTLSTPSLDMARLEELVERAERAAVQLRSLDESANRASQISALDERLSGLERAMTAAEKLAAQVGAAESQLARLNEAREREAARIGAAAAEVERIGAACADLAARVEAAFELRDQLERAQAMRPQLAALRNDADAMTAEMRLLTENIGRLRAVHEDAMRAYKHASARLDGIDQRHQTTAARMDALERRAVAAEQALDSLVRIAAGVPDVNHQLNVLKALADQVAQKTAALEQQREAVERATGHAAQVVALSAQIETARRRQG